MVTFTFGEREAHMSLDSGLGDTAVLRWSKSPINRPEAVSNGEHATNFLAEKWHCKPEEISNDLPREITTPEQELDFVIFYRHQPMAIETKGEMPKLVWVDWSFKSNSNERYQPYRSWIEPLWRDVVTRVEFPAVMGFYENALRRIMKGDNGLGFEIATGWQMVDHGGVSFIHVDMWGNYLSPFPVVEGEMRDGLFHPHRLTDRVIKVTIPHPKDAERAMKIVREEKVKAIKKMADELLTNDTDVALVEDYPYTLLYGLDKLPPEEVRGYDIFWTHRSSALLVRIPASGQIRCPDQFRGHLIGTKGVKINELAKKHGHRYLKVV